MAFPGNVYAPPGVYTKTLLESPVSTNLEGLKIPTFIGTGNEILYQSDLQVIRGSSASVDQQVVFEDETSRAVVQVTATGEVILGAFNCVLNRVQVRNYPIVSGNGTGTTSNSRDSVSATINGEPVVVMGVLGTLGIVELAQAPDTGDEVRITYYYNRTDTLTTDALSDQVTSDRAVIRGQLGIASGSFFVFTADNNILTLTVDDQPEVDITLAVGSYSASQVSALIRGGAVGSLDADSYTNNQGNTAVMLIADHDIVIGDGSANAALGFVAGTDTARNRNFITFQGPIVDGTNGGITTTDTADVTVKVDGVQVIPSAVDGANRTVTLALAPASGSTVTIQYYFNSWQDTFDYLANINITEVLRSGITPDRNDYIDGVDFVLKDDKLVWGTAALVSSGTTTVGSTVFGPTQISTLLVDQRAYLEECSEVVDTTVSPSVASRMKFRLPNVATTGNGRSTPLGQSLFQSISNSRIDLPTDRPDLITAYWGFSLQDALDRGPVTVKSVDSTTATVTLESAVDVGATVWASFYYNTVADEEYTLTNTLSGVSSIGQYEVADEDGNVLYGAVMGAKSAALSTITLNFPSGSEYKPGARFEGGSGTSFSGPVSEVVTVTFATSDSTPAKYSVPGSDPYYIYGGASDQAGLLIDSGVFSGDIDLEDPVADGAAGRLGFFGHLMSGEVVYDATSGGTTYTVDDANKSISLTVDGVLLTADAATGAGTVAAYATAINTSAAATAPRYIGATRFTSPVAIAASDYDEFLLHYTGDVSGVGGNETVTITPGTYNSAGSLVTEINTQLGILMAGAFATGTVTPIVTQSTGTATCAVVLAGETLTIGGVPLTATNGARTPGNDDFDMSSGVAGTIAIDLAAAINDFFNSFAAIATAGVPVGGLVTLTAVPLGVLGDAVALVGDVNLVVSGALMSGGVSPAALDTVTIGGVPLTAVAVARTPGSDNFDVSSSVAATIAIDLAAAINDPLNSFAAIVTAVAVGPAVNLTAVPLGVLGNVVTLVSSATFTPSGAGFLAGGGVGAIAYILNCFSDINGRLGFEVQKDPADSAGFLEFIDHGTSESDFSILAGFDTDAAAQGSQTKLYDGPIAKRYSGGGAGALKHDRLILRNRLLPGSGSINATHAVSQCQLEMQGVPGIDFIGLSAGEVGLSGYGATVKPATMVGTIGFADGQGSGYIAADPRNGQPVVVFYDGTGTAAANNVFKFNIDNNPVTVQFTASATGTATPLGPYGGTYTDTVTYQILSAMVPSFGANVAAVWAAGYLQQEGAALRINSITTGQNSSVLIGTGSANSSLGFSSNAERFPTAVDAKQVASAMMANHAATVAAYILSYTAPTASYFAAEALAGVLEDELGAEHLYLQSQSLGIGSNLTWVAAASHDVLTYGTGLEATVGSGAVGEAGISGFYVTSSDPVDGSGTADTSVFNSGTGQDGVVGQTYRDSVTGLTFTLLSREGGFGYPDSSYFTFVAGSKFTTDANIPVIFPGVEVTVSNTAGVGTGDTALVETFRRSGQEPAVGDLYYCTYKYQKQSFPQALYTKISVIEQEMGTINPDNPLSLASYLSMINGAVVVGLKQVAKETNSQQASLVSYRNAVDDLGTPFAGGITPDIITPLRGDSLSFYQYLSKHLDIQSSIRYRQERTAICGFTPAINIRDAGRWANQINATRFRLVYPDSVTLTLTDVLGAQKEFFVEGFYLASALAGSIVSPNLDVATPWTNRTIYGFNELGRKLDLVEQNTVAQDGVTVIYEKGNVLSIRQGFTTDMTNILTKLPTIIQIVDEVQQLSRANLDRFIGVKFLPGVMTQIETAMAQMFKRLVRQQIISAFTGITVEVAPDDPTVAEVTAAFIPVFPLLYIKVTFQLRASSF